MVERDVLTDWYHGEPEVNWQPLLSENHIQAFFGITDLIEDMIHLTTQDEDESPDVYEWLEYLIDLAPLPVPHLSDAFKLMAGGIGGGENEAAYVRYVAGNGDFDSSFPLLIYPIEDHKAMEAHRQQWRAAHPNEYI